MKIHISEPCKNLLNQQYVTEPRTDEGLKDKVGGFNSFFLLSKENRKPLSEGVIKALLPSEKEAPKLDKDKKKKDDKLEDAKLAYEAWLDYIEARDEERIMFDEERKKILMWKPPWCPGGKAMF